VPLDHAANRASAEALADVLDEVTSVSRLAKAMKIDRGTLYRWMGGEEPIPVYAPKKIAAGLISIGHPRLAERAFAAMTGARDVGMIVSAQLKPASVDDVRSAGLRLAGTTGAGVESIRKALADGKVSRVELAEVIEFLEGVKRDAEACEQAIESVADAGSCRAAK
jgi:hypothetical protein